MNYEAAPAKRSLGFGDRVRAARGYAGGISQAVLAERIQERFPGVEVSARTIKRVEGEDPAVRGTLEEWAQWVGAATETPVFFLEYGFMDIDLQEVKRARWQNFVLTDWLRIGARTLWFMRHKNADLAVQRSLLRQLRREGGIPFSEDEIESPSSALLRMLSHIKSEDRWMYEKISQLLTDYGVKHWASDDGLTGLPFPGLRDIEILRMFRDARGLSDEEMARVRSIINYQFRLELEPDPGIPPKLKEARRARETHPAATLVARLVQGEALSESEQKELREGLAEFMQHPEILTGIDWQRLRRGEPQMRTDLDVLWGAETERYEAERLFRLDRAPTPQLAGDAPLPEPPGELGRRAQEHLPTTGDREQQPTPEEPDAQQGTGQ